jgi:hypothetical protein
VAAAAVDIFRGKTVSAVEKMLTGLQGSADHYGCDLSFHGDIAGESGHGTAIRALLPAVAPLCP